MNQQQAVAKTLDGAASKGSTLSSWIAWFSTRGAKTNNNDTTSQESEPRDQGAARRQVLVVQENQDDPEFMDVTHQHLSYAEAASMATRSTDKQNINKSNDNNKNNNVGGAGHDTILDSKDLETEVLDYQMCEAMKRNIKNKILVNHDGYNLYFDNLSANSPTGHDSLDFIDESVYEDKIHRRSKKAKYLKKGK